MSNYNNVNRVLIGDGTNGAVTNIKNIEAGDLVLLDQDFNAIPDVATAAALSKFKPVFIAAGTADGKAILSSPIHGNTVSAYEGADFAAPAELDVIVGYNGDAGTGIVVDPSTEYRLRITILDDHRTHGMRTTLMDYNYAGGPNATAEDCVATIACYYAQKEYGQNFMHDKVRLLRVSDGKQYIRYSGTGPRSPILKVVEVIDANTVKFDVPFNEGVNVTVPAANVGILDTQTEFGFKLNGIPQEAMLSRTPNEPWGRYEWINYKAFFGEAEATDFESAAQTTVVTELNPGNGYWKQVAFEEEQAKGYLGDTSKRRFDDKRIVSNVVVDEEYDVVNVIHHDIHRGDFQDTYNAPLKTTIYIPNDSAQGDDTPGNNEFLAILNAYFGTVVGFPLIQFS